MENGIIYKATNILNKKIYIGQTTNTLELRRRNHFYNAFTYKKTSHNGAFTKALKKYGKEAFKWEIIYTTTNIEELNQKEQEFIITFNSLAPNGYNLTAGGNGIRGHKFSEESKRKISKSLSGEKHPRFGLFGPKNPLFGRKHTKEALIKIQKASAGSNNPNYGRKMTEEQKHKLRLANTGKKQSISTIYKRNKSIKWRMQPVTAINLSTKETLDFESIYMAATKLGTRPSNIYRIVHLNKNKIGKTKINDTYFTFTLKNKGKK